MSRLEYMLIVRHKYCIAWIITENIGFSAQTKAVRLDRFIVILGNLDMSRDLGAILFVNTGHEQICLVFFSRINTCTVQQWRMTPSHRKAQYLP